MWVDLLTACVDRAQVDCQSNAYLLELWKQLKPEQQYMKLGTAKAVPAALALHPEDQLITLGTDPGDDGLLFKYD